MLRIPKTRDRNPHALHQAVAAATGLAGRPGERALWAAPTPGRLIVQTPAGFDPAAIDGAVLERVVDVAAVLARLRPGTRVQFGLVACPCRAERVTADQRPVKPRRVPLPHAERPAWLHRKLNGALTVDTLMDGPLPAVSAARPDGRAVLARHLFTGTATVGDPARLAGLIRSGVGPGKAYGCGLLTVREAP